MPYLTPKAPICLYLSLSIDYKATWQITGYFALIAHQFINVFSYYKNSISNDDIYIWCIVLAVTHDKHLPNQCMQKVERERAWKRQKVLCKENSSYGNLENDGNPHDPTSF